MRRRVVVAGDHQRRRGHRREIDRREERIVLGGVRAQRVATARRGEQDAGLDPRFCEAHRVLLATSVLRAEEHTRGVSAHRVADDADLAALDAPGDCRHRTLDRIELVEDAGHILRTRSPEQRRIGVLRVAERERLRVEVRGDAVTGVARQVKSESQERISAR